MNIKQIEEDGILLEFLSTVAPEQMQFVSGEFFKHGENYAFGIYKDGRLVAAIRYCCQDIGEEQCCPIIRLHESSLTEAKINVFVVHRDFRGNGFGSLLQKHVIEHAKKRGCYQVSSYSTYDKVANYHIKLKLGFCAQPEKQPDGTRGCYFLMKL